MKGKGKYGGRFNSTANVTSLKPSSVSCPPFWVFQRTIYNLSVNGRFGGGSSCFKSISTEKRKKFGRFSSISTFSLNAKSSEISPVYFLSQRCWCGQTKFIFINIAVELLLVSCPSFIPSVSLSDRTSRLTFLLLTSQFALLSKTP